MSGVPQGSVLFNIFINDFVFAIKSSQVCNFADDNTVFACVLSLILKMQSLCLGKTTW